MCNGALSSKRKLLQAPMLNNALQYWQDWGFSSKPVLLKTFKQGQNHCTGLIEVANKRFVLKVFQHSYKRTINAERWANTLDLSPKIVYAANNIQILDYIVDQGFSENKLSVLADAIQSMHSARYSPTTEFDLLGFAHEYLQTADASTLAWHQQLLPILNEFLADPTPWAFCHNDLVVENCLFSPQGNAVIIDWEFAQPNNPWFDLAAVILYFKLNKTQAKEFLENYQTGWSNKISERIFISSQIAVLWLDLLWNLKQHGMSYRAKNQSRFVELMALAEQRDILLIPNAE